MSTGLDVSDVVSVEVNLAPEAAQFANVDSLLIMGDSNVIDVVERIRSYDGITSVGADFSTTDPEFLAAQNFFSQVPQPTQAYIGRWASSATAGALKGVELNATQQQLANFTPVTNGGIDFTINTVAHNLTGLDFSAASNLNAVATVITTALGGAGVCTWNGESFFVASGTTGINSIVAYATAGTGTDVSTILGLTQAAGADLIPGIAAETALAAVQLLDDLPTRWYGFTDASPEISDDDRFAIAGYIQAGFHIYGTTTQSGVALDPTNTTDIGSRLKAAGFTRSFAQYSSSSAYAAASAFGRIFTVNFNANNSTITLAFKQEPGVTPETLKPSQAAALNGKRYIYFVNYNNSTAIIKNGWMSGPAFIDEIQGLDWLANAVQTNLFNLLYTSTTKIPQTDEGNHQLVTMAEATCNGAKTNGLVAPGTWTTQGFGTLEDGDFLPLGYYVYAQPVAQQAAADREARKSVPIQIAVKLAGAIQTVSAIINVNR